MRVIGSVDDFLNCVGTELGASEWFTVTQDLINLFADATLDHQWIHTDPQRAKSESPFGSTIAHGYLTLSLLPYLLNQVMTVENLDRLVNYGVDKMVFKSVVRCNDRIRLSATMKKAKDLGNICLATIHCIVMNDRDEDPVLEGEIKYIYYFK